MTTLSIEGGGDGQPPVRVPAPVLYVLITVGGIVASAWVGYAAAQSKLESRISVLESQYIQMHADVNEIRTDVKTLLGRRP